MNIEFPDFDNVPDNKVYYILLKPGQPIYSWVRALQDDVDLILHRRLKRSSVPHITLLQFFMSEKHEPLLTELTREFSGNLDCSALVTGGLAEFPGIQTVYVDIKHQETLKQQFTEFAGSLLLKGLIRNDDSVIHKADKLHITVAKQVPLDKYGFVRHHLFSRILNDHAVNVESVVLLKGPGSVSKWDKVNEFPVIGNPSMRTFF